MIFINSDTEVTWEGMTDTSGNIISDATVSGAVLDTLGNSLQTFSMAYTSGGNYVGTLTAAQSAGLTPGTQYQLKITATRTNGQSERRMVRTTADYRGLS